MTCYLNQQPRQTVAERKAQVRKAISVIGELIAARKVELKVGPQGAVTFTGIPERDRADMADACIYRLVKSGGSAAAKLALQRAEMTSGTAVNRAALAAGVHSHDGGKSWSTH